MAPARPGADDRVAQQCLEIGLVRPGVERLAIGPFMPTPTLPPSCATTGVILIFDRKSLDPFSLARSVYAIAGNTSNDRLGSATVFSLPICWV